MPIPTLQVVAGPRDAAPGSSIAELDQAKLTAVEWVRNDIGILDFWMPARSPKITAPLLLQNEIQLWFGSWLAWWGFVWQARSNKKGTAFRCQELLGYLEGRDIRETLTYTDTEQRTIGWNLVNYAQTGADRALNITSAAIVGTTKLRTRVYLAEEAWSVLGALRALSRVIDGPDFEIAVFGDGRRELTFYHPGQGLGYPAPRSDIAIEWGGNCGDYDVIEEALPGKFANDVRILGPVADEEGTTRLSGIHRDATSATTYGEWELTMTDGALNSTQGWLDERAQEEATARSRPLIEAGFEVLNVNPTMLGVIGKGDVVRASVHDGRVNLEANYRVHGIRYEHSAAPAKLKLAVTPV